MRVYFLNRNFLFEFLFFKNNVDEFVLFFKVDFKLYLQKNDAWSNSQGRIRINERINPSVHFRHAIVDLLK